MIFDEAFAHLGAIEGSYSNNPSDSGGETYRGIARKFWPGWSGWPLIDKYSAEPGFPETIDDSVLEQSVKEFYRKNFWERNRLDDVAEISPKIAAEIFDTCVNTGVRGQFLQRALNVLNRSRRDYPDIKIDGDIGPATLSALRSFLAVRKKPEESERVMLTLLNCQQGMGYVELVERREKDESFIYGWILQRA